jgi:hypothetical protein
VNSLFKYVVKQHNYQARAHRLMLDQLILVMSVGVNLLLSMLMSFIRSTLTMLNLKPNDLRNG